MRSHPAPRGSQVGSPPPIPLHARPRFFFLPAALDLPPVAAVSGRSQGQRAPFGGATSPTWPPLQILDPSRPSRDLEAGGTPNSAARLRVPGWWWGGHYPPPSACAPVLGDGSGVRVQRRLSGQRVSARLRLLLLSLPAPGLLTPLFPHPSPTPHPQPHPAQILLWAACAGTSLRPPLLEPTGAPGAAGLLLPAHKTRWAPGAAPPLPLVAAPREARAWRGRFSAGR